MSPENKSKPPENKESGHKTKEFKAWALAGELGYLIAIPIVIFALLGRFADKAWHTAPWLMLLGILISIFTSTWLIYKKVKDAM